MGVKCQVIIVFVTIYLFRSLNACRCMVGHPQQEICDRDFAMKAKILTNKIVLDAVPYARRLTVKVEYNFKGRSGDTVTLYTYHQGSLCGADLTIGKTYVITGKFVENRRYISTCYWIEEWNSVDKCVQMKLYKGIYNRNCNCKVRQCRPDNCGTTSRHECTLNIFENQPKLSNGLCRRGGILGACLWEECPKNFAGRTCFIGHPQEEICSADFAFRATVIQQFGRYRPQYLVEVDYNFKGRAGNEVILYTKRKDARRLDLRVGTRYLFTGRIDEGRMVISSCNWIQEWDSIDQCVQDNLLRGVYTRNCDCEVKYCKRGECDVPASEGCGLNVGDDDSRINGVCKVYGRSCIWETCS